MFLDTAFGETINLDHLVRVDQANDRQRRRGLMSDGSEVLLGAEDVRQITLLTRPLVPARPEDRAVLVTWYGDDSSPNYGVDEINVVAWALDGEVMVPVFADEILPAQQRVGVLMPGGWVCDPINYTWPTREQFIDDAVAGLRQQAQRQLGKAA